MKRPQKLRRTQRRQKTQRQKTGPEQPFVLKGTMRLNRYIAHAGVCSRRKADELIAEGKVKVNDRKVNTLGTQVKPGDTVIVAGKLITPLPFVYILLNKPKDTITTTNDERSRRTVMDLIQDDEVKTTGAFPVGRLDRNTFGALLITNDGDLAHRLMHPKYRVEKLYQVRTEEPVKPHDLEQLKTGVELEDGPASADEVAYIMPNSDHRHIGIRLHEGRNRQIRRMFEKLGYTVEHLERVNYAGLTLKGIRRSKWRRLTTHEVRKLRRSVGLP